MSLIHVTQSARDHIDRIKANHGKAYFRLHVKSAGCSGYRYDPQVVDALSEGDEEVILPGNWSLLMSEPARRLLKGMTIDYVAKGLSHQLVYLNPNADDECGCGESFNVPEDE